MLFNYRDKYINLYCVERFYKNTSKGYPSICINYSSGITEDLPYNSEQERDDDFGGILELFGVTDTLNEG